MKNKYEFDLSAKTRLLNIFRQVFKNSLFEKFLVSKTLDSDLNSFWSRACPPNYLYSERTLRRAVRNDIIYDLDISDYVEHLIYFGFKDVSLEKLFEYAKNAKVIIDIGVNIGLTSLNFAKISPDAVIIGFEPDIKNFRKAEKNLSINEITNVKILNKGLGEASDTVRLSRVNAANAGMNRILPKSSEDQGQVYESTEIQIIKFDDFAAEENLSKIDLIKIDVEGYELNVLKGAANSIRKYKPVLFIELDDDNLREQNSTAGELVLFLEKTNYECFDAKENSRLRSSDSFDNCYFDIICHPA